MTPDPKTSRAPFFTLLLAACGLVLFALGGAALFAQTPARAATVRFVRGGGVPLANTAVRVLCYRTPDPGRPAADRMLRTGADGSAALPPVCPYIAALHLEHTQPAASPDHGPAFWVYTTSWAPLDPVPQPVGDEIVIPDAQTLTLFNVAAGLAWEPAPGSPFVRQLRAGLRAASAYLYDLTEGQMAFGPVTINTGGFHWDASDLRFLAANDARPSAYIGGILPEARPYTAPATGVETVFAPGAVLLGRYWDGLGAADPAGGAWDRANAYQTLVHEWAHYALFLYDEYQSVSGFPVYCTCADLPAVTSTSVPTVCSGVTSDLAASTMAYHYTASEFWLTAEHGAPPDCTASLQALVHGVSDWETLGSWHAIQGLPAGLAPLDVPAGLKPGPEPGVVADLFGVPPAYRMYLPAMRRPEPAPAGTSQPEIQVKLAEPFTAPPPSQVYLLEGSLVAPTRILHQGSVLGVPAPPDVLGRIQLLGVHPDDRLRVFVDRFGTAETTGERLTHAPGPAAAPVLADGLEVLAEPDPWKVSLDAVYAIRDSRLTTMTVKLSSFSHDLTKNPPVAQLCVPDLAVGCHPDWRLELKPADAVGQDWVVDFTPLAGVPELPLYGVVRVTAQEVGEIIRWFKVKGGVGPAHMDGDAPEVDGELMVSVGTEQPGPCNRVIVMPAADQALLETPLPGNPNDPLNSIQGLLSVPLDIDVLLPGGHPDGCQSGLPGRLPPLQLTFFYNLDTLRRAGINPSQLRILHYFAENGVWSEVTDREAWSEELFWQSSFDLTEAGVYAIGYTGQ